MAASQEPRSPCVPPVCQPHAHPIPAAQPRTPPCGRVVTFKCSNFSAPRAISSVALITTFLVDGDKSGDDNKKQLTEAGVQNENVFQLPKHKAIEDLVDRAVYFLTVN